MTDTHQTDPATWKPPLDAPCVTAAGDGIDFFGGRDDHDYDAGRAARAVCAACPHVEPCVTAAVARREQYGIWGGTGGARRRALRRWIHTDRWPDALAAHLRRLRGEPAEPGDAVLLRAAGGERTHGVRSSYAAGCRDCDACALAAGLEGQLGAGLHTVSSSWRGEAA